MSFLVMLTYGMHAGERIAQERIAQGISQQELADKVKRLGGQISQTGIDKMEKRGTKRPRYAREIAMVLKVMQDWLVTGKAPKYRADANEDIPVTQLSVIAWVSAGEMAKEDISDVEIGRMALSGLDPLGDWIALKVKGDSMDRISPPGSIILVNRKERRLVSNGCYVIGDEDGTATYKRYRADPPRYEPVSTNPENETIYPDNEPTIVGRVRRTIYEL